MLSISSMYSFNSLSLHAIPASFDRQLKATVGKEVMIFASISLKSRWSSSSFIRREYESILKSSIANE